MHGNAHCMMILIALYMRILVDFDQFEYRLSTTRNAECPIRVHSKISSLALFSLTLKLGTLTSQLVLEMIMQHFHIDIL